MEQNSWPVGVFSEDIGGSSIGYSPAPIPGVLGIWLTVKIYRHIHIRVAELRTG